MTSDNFTTIISDYLAAWNAHDPSKVAECFTEHCVYEDAALGFIHRSREEIAAFFGKFFYSYPNIHSEFSNIFGDGRHVAWEWTMAGNYERVGPSGIPASGQHVTFRGASIAELDQGRISRITDFWNVPKF